MKSLILESRQKCKLISTILSFQIQNKYLVEGMDVVIRYGLYNVGDTVASDIVLTEAGFGTDDFDVAGTVLTYICIIARFFRPVSLCLTVILRTEFLQAKNIFISHFLGGQAVVKFNRIPPKSNNSQLSLIHI